MNDCCDASGGRVSITMNGRTITSRGGIRIMPDNVETSEQANDDGSFSIQSRSAVPSAEFTLIDKCDLDLDELKRCGANITFDLIDMRRKWLFTNSRVVGRANINTDTGEISGLKAVCRQPRRISY